VIWLLDTNACACYLRSECGSAIAQRLAEKRAEDIVSCSVVRAELLFGALRSNRAAENLAKVRRFLSPFASLPFDDAAAETYGQIRADLASRGLAIGPNDLLIAAIAQTNNATLVTHNVNEFGRVAGLSIEDWEAVD
jgi:tRNA(fMet)-specific endonuclease VapC